MYTCPHPRRNPKDPIYPMLMSRGTNVQANQPKNKEEIRHIIEELTHLNIKDKLWVFHPYQIEECMLWNLSVKDSSFTYLLLFLNLRRLVSEWDMKGHSRMYVGSRKTVFPCKSNCSVSL